MLQNFSSIKSLHATSPVEQTHTVKGWIKSLRNSKKFSFMVLNDGSSHKDLQIVVDATLENYAEVAALGLHSSVEVTGLLVASQGKGQSIEMQAKSITIVGTIPEDYPLQKKETSLEFLRENAHLRGRTQLFSAVFRIRHTLSKATHDFFHERGYFYLHTPIITSSDGEGAGEMFRVSTLKAENPPMVAGKVDYSKDYFARETFLNVTGQLEGECYAMALGKIYTFGPTFRAENSNTARHLSEFWMIEPEVAFADLDDVADLGRDYIQFMIKRALEHNRDELEFLAGKNNNNDLIATLEHVASSPFARVTYTEVIDILKSAQAAGHKFEFAAPDWGGDLATEHERYMCEIHFKKPTIVTDYPKGIKAFYMKQNPDGKTVRCMDILVPGVGEIIGGSQREEDFDKLTTRMKEMGLDPQAYWWYTDLRRFGTTPHAGFGLGFERAVMYVTGMTNIRDVIAFPRTPKNAEF